MARELPNAQGGVGVQTWAVFRLSLLRFARSKFMVANLILCAIPVLVALSIVLLNRGSIDESINEVHSAYELLVRVIFIQFVVFFCANIFGFSVMRQDIEEQTLHYLILLPAPRWTLVVGKFLAYMTLGSATCVASLWITYLVFSIPLFGPGEVARDLFAEGRFLILLKESGVLVLALLLYGTVALLASSFFKTFLYALVIMGWEFVAGFLPQSFKEWSGTHYLYSLLPDRAATETATIQFLGDPASPVAGLAVLTIVPLALLAIAIFIFQSRQCLYGDSA